MVSLPVAVDGRGLHWRRLLEPLPRRVRRADGAERRRRPARAERPRPRPGGRSPSRSPSACTPWPRAGSRSGDAAIVLGCGPVGLAVDRRAAAARASGRSWPPTTRPKRRAWPSTSAPTEVVDPRARAGHRRLAPGRRPPSARDLRSRRRARHARRGHAHGAEGHPHPGGRGVHGARHHPAHGRHRPRALDPVRPRLRAGRVRRRRCGPSPRATSTCRRSITGTVAVDGVPQAFADLANPETHAKILVEP